VIGVNVQIDGHLSAFRKRRKPKLGASPTEPASARLALFAPDLGLRRAF